MKVINRTPFVVGTMMWEDANHRPMASVIVKATFSIKKTEGPSPVQMPIFSSDKHWDDDVSRSVKFESDMVPYKVKTDVVLVGKAYAPIGHSAKHVDVSLRVGRLEKTVRVIGDRRWFFPSRLLCFPRKSAPKPFVSMDLVYERAYGGIDHAAALYSKENLVGVGFIGKKTPRSLQNRALPNLEDPNRMISSWKSRPKPAGFGFYSRGWMPRLAYVGDYDEESRKDPHCILPKNFSPLFYNGAHPDLQVDGYLRGDEEVELRNVSRVPVVRFSLPGVRAHVVISKWGPPLGSSSDELASKGKGNSSINEIVSESVPVNLDTLVIIPDDEIFYLVFRGVCSLASSEGLEVAAINVNA